MGLFAPCEYNRYWRRREKPFGTTMTFAIIPRQCEKSGRAVAVAAARHCDLDRRVSRSVSVADGHRLALRRGGTDAVERLHSRLPDGSGKPLRIEPRQTIDLIGSSWLQSIGPEIIFSGQASSRIPPAWCRVDCPLPPTADIQTEALPRPGANPSPARQRRRFLMTPPPPSIRVNRAPVRTLSGHPGH